MSQFRRAPLVMSSTNQNIISSLKATQMIDSKPILPMDLISIILDLLPVPDLIRCARASKKMLLMVYEDSRWVKRLRLMGVSHEEITKDHSKNTIQMKREMSRMKRTEGTNGMGYAVFENDAITPGNDKTTTFDPGTIEKRQKVAEKQDIQSLSLSEFVPMTTWNSHHTLISPIRSSEIDFEAPLRIFTDHESTTGPARVKYSKIHVVLAPFYTDLVASTSYQDLVIFKLYQDPEKQAQILAHLQKFSKCDLAQGWEQRLKKVRNMVDIFETNVLSKFKLGYKDGDIDGKMCQYAHVMARLNGGHAGIDFFIHENPIFSEEVCRIPRNLIDQDSTETASLEISRDFFEKLARMLNEQANVIDRVFPIYENVYQLLFEKSVDEILMVYVKTLLGELYRRSRTSYTRVIPGLFQQSIRFGSSLEPTKNSVGDFPQRVNIAISNIFETHIDLYLKEELEQFKRKAEADVNEWESKLTAQDASAESFFMANFNRQADKKDFLSSFKKVVMMPVNVLPPFGVKQITARQPSNRGTPQSPMTPVISKPATPTQKGSDDRSSSPILLPVSAPTDELAAKAALMASRLEGIRSLFSIEIALHITHDAKASIERVAHLVQLQGQTGKKVRHQCSEIFILLLQILGQRHIKPGFDKAVDHLSKYNPREIKEHQRGVAPLVTFLELVNVGDLISQMIDVFFEQQLCTNKLVDRNDFLEPAAKAKKHFENMLDERVAAGLNTGIDVLMDEVEYLLATTQLPTDYNPTPSLNGDAEVGSTKAAELVVELVESHTKMLIGSTDKSMLDVFNQEVGRRLFTVICKHLKRQRISIDGSMKLISDMNLFFLYTKSLKNSELIEYFKALKELSQLYLIAPIHAKEIAEVIADSSRFGGIFRAEEVYEFVERRADWFSVRRDVEKAMYGIGCTVM
ncbi:Bgt-2637 [Blumeria graminis f. sp. tritici]|uniref:Bgt-2637 n=1 Tax=Blumeria graminis f. sp. tritici TaxID=62690 RepID=A0A9X9MJI9_BLUGR|nr:Bgt-2637 [Blumeria graminis f. sp. tritici]